jgi:hypothetical protein
LVEETLAKEIRAARTDLAKLEHEYGAAAADNTEPRRPTMRGFKIAHGRLGKQLRTARARVVQLFEQRREVPKPVEVRDLNERAVVKLATECKHLTAGRIRAPTSGRPAPRPSGKPAELSVEASVRFELVIIRPADDILDPFNRIGRTPSNSISSSLI